MVQLVPVDISIFTSECQFHSEVLLRMWEIQCIVWVKIYFLISDVNNKIIVFVFQMCYPAKLNLYVHINLFNKPLPPSGDLKQNEVAIN